MDYAKFKSQILLPQQRTEYLGVMKLFSCQERSQKWFTSFENKGNLPENPMAETIDKGMTRRRPCPGTMTFSGSSSNAMFKTS